MVRTLIWDFYAALKAYRAKPEKSRHRALRARFDRIFHRRTGFVTLDRLLARLHANKAELLMVLDHPATPLNCGAAKQTDGSENDIRCQVIRRKISAGTRSDLGRDCRDAFLGLTCNAFRPELDVPIPGCDRFGALGRAVLGPSIREKCR
jgi:hypothetical protein